MARFDVITDALGALAILIETEASLTFEAAGLVAVSAVRIQICAAVGAGAFVQSCEAKFADVASETIFRCLVTAFTDCRALAGGLRLADLSILFLAESAPASETLGQIVFLAEHAIV
jgi:hypothetical protein